MSERITKSDVVVRAQNVNRRLHPIGRSVSVEWRNGYCALDEYKREYDVRLVPDERWTCVRTITAGTTREIADFLHAMIVGIDLSRAD